MKIDEKVDDKEKIIVSNEDNDILEYVRHLYYIKSQGFSVIKKEWFKIQSFEPKLYKSKENKKGVVSFFCDILYPILPKGQEDKSENYFLKVYLTEYKVTVDLPVLSIINSWNAGWPRAGRMAEGYTDFPWRLLKPIKEFIDNPIDIKTLSENLLKEKIWQKDKVFEIYYNNILPLINKSLNVKKNDKEYKIIYDTLNNLYDSAVSDHKKEMLKAYTISKAGLPYIGTFVLKEEYLNLTKEENDNPFIIYTKECIEDEKCLYIS